MFARTEMSVDEEEGPGLEKRLGGLDQAGVILRRILLGGSASEKPPPRFSN
jgi:hypothetical protein